MQDYEIRDFRIKSLKKKIESDLIQVHFKQKYTLDQYLARKSLLNSNIIYFRVSWNFLSEYINASQSRHDKMKAKISEAIDLAKRLEEAAARAKIAQMQDEESKRIQKEKLEKEQTEKKKNELNAYERPQSKALAESFLETTKEIFLLSSEFESSKDPNCSSLKMKLKLNINRRTGQITDSFKQMSEISKELIQLSYESRSFSKQAFYYCLILLSSKLLVN